MVWSEKDYQEALEHQRNLEARIRCNEEAERERKKRVELETRWIIDMWKAKCSESYNNNDIYKK